MDEKEYRAQLLKKLETLVGTLRVAIVKIEAGMQAPHANVERLTKVRDNLLNTLRICERARTSLSKVGARRPTANQTPSGMREYTEMSSLDEYRKFKTLPPIVPEDIRDVDWHDLLDKLR